MALLPIITILFIALIIGFSFSKGLNKKEIKKLKRKKKLTSKLSIVIPVYFVLLLVPTIWMQIISNKSINEFKSISEEEFKKASQSMDKVEFAKLKDNISVELGQSKSFKINNEALSIDEETHDTMGVCIVENSNLKDEIVVTPYRKRNFVESNDVIYDISVILPFDSYDINGNNIKIKSQGINTKLTVFSKDFDHFDGIRQFKGILIEVPKGTKINDDFRINIIRE